MSRLGNESLDVDAMMPKGQIYVDITGLKASQNNGAYVRMFLRRNPEVSRKIYLTFGSDGLSCWKALRALANVSRGQTRFLEFVDGRSHRVVKMVDFHPRVAGLAAKQKLSRTERNRLRRLKNAVKLTRTCNTGHGKTTTATTESEAVSAKISHELRLSDVPPEGLYSESIWPGEPQRDNRFGNSGFSGNCSSTVCEQVLCRYTQRGEIVLDAMAGSGTMLDVANALVRKCVAFDINPVDYRKDIACADARSLPLGDESVDFVFLHPPYSKVYRYSDPALEGDLSTMEYEEFLAACETALCEAFRVLRPGKFAAVLVGEMRKDLKFYDIPSELSLRGGRVGFQLFDKIIKPIVHERSKSLRSIIVARRHNFHLIKFETLLVFKKTFSEGSK